MLYCCCHRRLVSATGISIQKGLIRYLCIVIDFSRAAAAETDFRPRYVDGQVEASGDSSLPNVLELVHEHPEVLISRRPFRDVLVLVIQAISWRPFRNARYPNKDVLY